MHGAMLPRQQNDGAQQRLDRLTTALGHDVLSLQSFRAGQSDALLIVRKLKRSVEEGDPILRRAWHSSVRVRTRTTDRVPWAEGVRSHLQHCPMRVDLRADGGGDVALRDLDAPLMSLVASTMPALFGRSFRPKLYIAGTLVFRSSVALSLCFSTASVGMDVHPSSIEPSSISASPTTSLPRKWLAGFTNYVKC